MEKCIQGYVLTATDLSPAAANGFQLGLRCCDHRKTIGEVGAKGFPDQLRAGAVLSFSYFLNLL